MSPNTRIGIFVGAAFLLSWSNPLVPTPPADAQCAPNQYFQTPPVRIGGFLNPRCIAVADFNEDGIQDLVVASPAVYTYGGAGGRIGILLGNGVAGMGDGTFQPEAYYAAGSAPFTPVVGDYNEDGIRDLAVTNWLSDNVSILLGNGVAGVGNGTFAPPINYAAGSRPFLMITGDYNEDGITDLAISNNGVAAVSVLLGQGVGGVGNGTFAPRVAYPLNQLSTGLASGDFNEDGTVDLVATENYAGTIAVLLGQSTGGVGNGTFAVAVHYPAGIEPFSIEPGDFNYDGIGDLIVTNGTSDGVKFLKGNGTLGSGNGTFAAFQTVGTGNAPGVVSGDFNLDGSLDLVVTVADPYVGPGQGLAKVLIGNATGSFATSPVTYALDHDPLTPVKGDFNSDGLTDLAIPNYYDSNISILFGGCFIPTAIQVSIASVRASTERVSIEWVLAQGAGALANVYRKDTGGEWMGRGTRYADGTGRLAFEDLEVSPGARYVYRLGMGSGTTEEFGGETEVVIPGLSLALERGGPNPAAHGPLLIGFSLPGSEAAELCVTDAAGRQVAARSVGGLGPGRHTLQISDGAILRPGVYLVRLTQSGRTVSTKRTVLR